MASVDIRNASGTTVGTVDLADDVFGVTPNVALMHQVVTAQLAGIRAGDHSTLTRAEVRGGGRKPWRQKGSGRARQGSTRAPHWRGGGVAMGPKPRSYAQRTPKKMVAAALRSALSDRAAEGKVVVVEAWDLPAAKTREAKAVIDTLGLTGKVLVVLDREQEDAARALRNLPKVHLILPSELNAYDVLCCDWVVFTRDNLPAGSGRPDTTHAADAPAPAADAEEAAGRSEPSASDQTSTEPRAAGQPPEAAAR